MIVWRSSDHEKVIAQSCAKASNRPRFLRSHRCGIESAWSRSHAELVRRNARQLRKFEKVGQSSGCLRKNLQFPDGTMRSHMASPGHSTIFCSFFVLSYKETRLYESQCHRDREGLCRWQSTSPLEPVHCETPPDRADPPL